MNKELQDTWDILVGYAGSDCGSLLIGGDVAIIAADELIKAQQEQNAELLELVKKSVSAMQTRGHHVPKEFYKAIAKAEGGEATYFRIKEGTQIWSEVRPGEYVKAGDKIIVLDDEIILNETQAEMHNEFEPDGYSSDSYKRFRLEGV